MKVDDFVTTGSEMNAAQQDLASTHMTDAVNSGIVGSADKSAMAIKADVMSSSSSAAAQQGAKKVVSSETAVSKASSMLQKQGSQLATDSVVNSKLTHRKLLSKANAKNAVKNAAIASTLEGSEFEGADDMFYKGKSAYKLGRKGASALQGKLGKKAAVDVSSGAGTAKKLGGLSEKKSMLKKSAESVQRKWQLIRNQRKVTQTATAAKSAGSSITRTAAVKGGAGGIGAMLGGVSAPVVLFIGFIMFLIIICGAAAGSQSSNYGSLSDTENEIVSFLRTKGVDDLHIAAILGNMAQESGGMHKFRADYCQKGGPGRGILQWEIGSDRFANLCALAAAKGTSWTDLNTQLEHMWSEFDSQFETYSNQYHVYPTGAVAGVGKLMTFSDWLKIDDLDWATESFERCMTRASMPLMNKRKAYAAEYYAILTSAGSAVGGLNIPVYYQGHGQPWSNISYSAGTIASSGCGPTSCAMVLSYITNKNITPDQTAAFAKSNGYVVYGEGTSWKFFAAAAKHWKAGTVDVTNSSSAAYAALQSGKPVICSQDPGIFTKGGHFIVLRGLADDGKVLVNDPNYNNAVNKDYNNRHFDMSEINAAAKVYFIFNMS